MEYTGFKKRIDQIGIVDIISGDALYKVDAEKTDKMHFKIITKDGTFYPDLIYDDITFLGCVYLGGEIKTVDVKDIISIEVD